jgi:hypothetical protein
MRRFARTLARSVLGQAPWAVPLLAGVREYGRPAVWFLARDLPNCIRWGRDAPRFAELIWVDPQQVTGVAMGAGVRSSGQVCRDWPPPRGVYGVDDDPIYQVAVARWVDGCSWEASGEIARMEQAIAQRGSVKGLRSRADIDRRCNQLDRLFETIQRDGTLRTQRELNPRAFRELGGIGIHLGPAGIPVRAENGRHRFAIARILRLRRMPARLGLVHVSALPHLGEARAG